MTTKTDKNGFGRDVKDDVEIVNGRIKESEVIQPPEVNPRLCALRRKREFERELKACDYSLDSLEI
jgi:hypothetical protein